MNNNADDMQRDIKIQIKTIFKESRFLFKFYFFFFSVNENFNLHKLKKLFNMRDHLR